MEQDETTDPSRRNLGSLLGVLGGVLGLASLAGRAEAEEPGVMESAPLTGSSVVWVDTIITVPVSEGGPDGGAGSGTNLRGIIGTDSGTNSTPVVIVGGYAAPGDGGGGVFYWSIGPNTADSGTVDDGGTVIVPAGATTGYWRRVYGGGLNVDGVPRASGVLNVKWFGAKCDGQTNDTPALMAAITALASAPGTIEIPGMMALGMSAPTPGTIVNVANHNGLQIKGSAPGAGIRYTAVPSLPMGALPRTQYLFGMIFSNCANLVISDLRFEQQQGPIDAGDGGGLPSTGFVGLYQCTYTRFERNVLYGSYMSSNGQHLPCVMAMTGSRNKFLSNHFEHNDISLQVGYAPESEVGTDLDDREIDAVVSGNTFRNGTLDFIIVGCNGAVVEGNLLDNPDPPGDPDDPPRVPGSGIVLGGAGTNVSQSMSITGNVIRRVAIGIQWDFTGDNIVPSDVTIAGNVIEECVAHGMSITQCLGLTISGNVVRDCNTQNQPLGTAISGMGIAVGVGGASANVTVIGNSIYNTSVGRMNTGLYLAGGCTGLVVANNVISNIRTTTSDVGIALTGTANDVLVTGNVVKDCGFAFFTNNSQSPVVSNLHLRANTFIVNSSDVTATYGYRGVNLAGMHINCRIEGNLFFVAESPDAKVATFGLYIGDNGASVSDGNTRGTFVVDGNTFALDGQNWNVGTRQVLSGIGLAAGTGSSATVPLDAVVSNNVFQIERQAQSPPTSITAAVSVTPATGTWSAFQCIGNVFKGFTTPAFNLYIPAPAAGTVVNFNVIDNVADGGITQFPISPQANFSKDAATIPNVPLSSQEAFVISQADVKQNRPTVSLSVGQTYFDTTLKKPIWVRTVGPPAVWVDGTGTPV